MIELNGKYTPLKFHCLLRENKCYPSIEKLISSQINFYNWWKNSYSGFIIRHNKTHKKFKLSNSKGIIYFSSDNEACVSFYESIFDKPIKIQDDLFEFYKQNNLKVGINVKKSIGFKTGMANGNCRKNQLKLSHYIDAAKDLDLNDSIKKRSAIYLSPLNIFLTPNPKKFQHYLNDRNIYDLGENNIIKEHLHSYIIKDILASKNGSYAYQLYCNMCEISYDEQIKKIFSVEEGTLSFHFEKKIKNQRFIKQNPIELNQNMDMLGNTLTLRNFILKKNYIGKNLSILISKNGDTPIFKYNHDDVLNQLGERITNLPCWNKYGYYTKSGSVLPKFCEKLNGIKIYP